MDRVEALTNIVQREVANYANVRDWKSKVLYVEDDKHHIYTVIDVPDQDHPLVSKAGVVVMARVVGSNVVINQDITDRPLFEQLVSNGIPREKIVLAYAGEKPPRTTEDE